MKREHARPPATAGTIQTDRFTFHSTSIGGVFEIQRHARGDERGTLTRFYCADEFAGAEVLNGPIVQMNTTVTKHAGTVRGLHFQRPPALESKVVTCMAGRVWDVAVDLRPDSPTFGEHFARELVGGDGFSLLLPPGVAHGVQALENHSTLLYLHTAVFDPNLDAGVHPEDPTLKLPWPLPVTGLSDRDRGLPDLQSERTRRNP